jgi:hypothetical protein
MLIISIISCFSVYELFQIISLNPWVELFIGGMLSLSIYLVGVMISKALTKQDFTYLRQLSGSFGPFSPIIKWLVNTLIKFS